MVAERPSEIDVTSVAIRRDDRHHAAGRRRRAHLAGLQFYGKFYPGAGAVRDQCRRLAENLRKDKARQTRTTCRARRLDAALIADRLDIHTAALRQGPNRKIYGLLHYDLTKP